MRKTPREEKNHSSTQSRKPVSSLRPLFSPLFFLCFHTAPTQSQSPTVKARSFCPYILNAAGPTASSLSLLLSFLILTVTRTNKNKHTHICDPRANCKHACINIYKTNPVVAAATRLISNLRLEGRRPSAPSPFPPTGTWASCSGRSAAPRLHKMWIDRSVSQSVHAARRLACAQHSTPVCLHA